MFDKGFLIIGSRTLSLRIISGFPTGPALVEDYVHGKGSISSFFEGEFSTSKSYLEKAAEVDSRFGPDERERVASMVFAPSKTGKLSLERFLAEGGYLVTTGQQPGLYLGPLYSLYKALTAVNLAQALESVLGKPVLPLFWIASEDHDWAEVDHTYLLDRENELRTFRIPAPEGLQSRPLHRIPIVGEGASTLSSFLDTLPSNDFSNSFAELIRDAYSGNATLSEGFRHVLEGLFTDFPLLFVDAAEPALKDASLPVLLKELEAATEHESLLGGVASRLEAEGYHTQVPILERGVNLLLEGPAGRDRLFREGNGFRLNHAGTVVSLEEVQQMVNADPSVLSPNVLLRPVVESTVFPTLGYVAGPGELAYFAQLKDFFRAHGLQMPVIHPRHSATLVEMKIGKVLDKFDLELEELAHPFHEVSARIAREDVPLPVRKALGEIRGALGRGAGALTKASREVDSTLNGPITQARNTALSAFEKVERKIVQSVKRQNEVSLGQLEKAQQNLFPLGKPQERVINPFQYLVRYGPELIPALLDEFPVALGPDSA